MQLNNLIEDINDRKLRFSDSNNNTIIFWNNPRPKFLVVLGSHIENEETVFSAYAKIGKTKKIIAATGEGLIAYNHFHFFEDELDIMVDEFENSEVIGDILSNNIVESAVELEEFKMEYYLS